MGPSAVRSSDTTALPDPTPEELAAGASLLERPQISSAAPPAAAPEPPPPALAVKRLVDAHSAPPAALPPPAEKDWCGSKGSEAVPEGAFGVDWSDACKSHDECYATPGASKLTCDYNLQQDMSLACAAQAGGLACQVFAQVYRHGVELFGQTAFEAAQAAKAGPP